MTDRDDLAKLIFITDNSGAANPVSEWEWGVADTKYAYAIADGLLANGWTRGGDTLAEARDQLLIHRDKGTTCPCCGQRVRVYRRTINGRMVKTLAAIYRAAVAKSDNPASVYVYVHVPSLGVDLNHEVAQLGWRGLVEEATSTREDGGRAGYWRLTEKGIAWLHGGSWHPRTPKYVSVYNGEILDYSDETVTVHDVVRNRFDLNELLGRTAS